MMPPDEGDIEQLELALHEPLAVQYFYNFLDDQLSEDGHYFKMLALYMDIRCYDEGLTKMTLQTNQFVVRRESSQSLNQSLASTITIDPSSNYI